MGRRSYFRPSNYTRNWKITLDKPLVWNPYQGHIVNGLEITVQTPNTATNLNSIEVNSLQGTDPNYNQQYLQVGMVLVAYGNLNPPPAGQFHWDPNRWLVISEINTSNNTLSLKKYDVTSNTCQNVVIGVPGTPITITANDYLTFKQLGFNGLSPNSAKNINYFNNGRGFNDTNAG